ncbi:hypothetical protein B0H14DRAFT_2833501 [Mycena olivaceomarginata]|nr:hypothetical protein B0H14DRAFT_2833501 [Mycena olivaceomarginata]
MEYKVHEPFLGRRPSIPSPMEGSAESLPDAVPTNFPDVFPDLKDVPLVYVLHVLAQQRDRMLAGLDAISSLPPSLLRSEMPESLRVPNVSPNDVIWPTHVLSIECEDFDPGQDTYIPIFPIHALVLAAHCSRIPCLEACSVEDGTTNLPSCIHIASTLPSNTSSNCRTLCMTGVAGMCIPLQSPTEICNKCPRHLVS